MFLIDSEASLIAAFRPRDRGALELPAGTKFPLFVRDYLAWTHPAGAHVFLLFNVPKGVPTGIAFRRDAQGGEPGATRMCEWCHSHGAADRIGLLTTDSSSRRRVGLTLCLDLGCHRRLDDAANRAGRSEVEASRLLVERIARFTREALHVDPYGANRG
jgi:hypothetical protein